jgi:hypothetical protein
METEHYAVSIESERIFLLSEAHQAHFTDTSWVRLGTHTEHPLIYIQPVETQAEETYELSYQSSGRRINCRSFLRQHNYHHTQTQRYQAEWSDAVGSLIIDLSVPVSD